MDSQPPSMRISRTVRRVANPTDADANMPAPAPFAPGFHIEGAKRQILGAIRARNVTDRKISVMWVVVPLLVGLVGSIIGMALVFMGILNSYDELMYGLLPVTFWDDIFLGFTIIMITEIVMLVIFGVLTHMLVERQNEHFQREAQLRMGVLSYLRASAGSPEREAAMAVEIATINSLHVQAMQEEQPHSAIGWALFMVLGFWIPLVNIVLLLYLFNFLMENIRAHDMRWNMFWQQTGSAMMKLGHNTDPRGWYAIVLPHRSFALYLVLSFITAGLFVFYWWYILIRDPNSHFDAQSYSEDMLVNIISH